MTEDLEDEKKSLNKDTTEINRGVELLLRRRRKPEKPKTFQVKFGNMISFFKNTTVVIIFISVQKIYNS